MMRNSRRAEMATNYSTEPRLLAATRRQVITGGVLAIGGVIASPIRAAAEPAAGISHSAESIHQEPSFGASRKRVYDALTDTKQFDQVTQLSGVMQSSAMTHNQKP